ncbi:hypothetical protein SCB49_07382 [unidentified eubacterium SCB49]|nr:hypothetical protein SCB49_07382 [unidentified eubacterium SCB49]
MSSFLKAGAYIFHPLFIPLLGVFFYYSVTPRFLQIELIFSHLLVVTIITIAIPLVVFFLLKNFGIVSSIHLRKVNERKLPLMIQCILLLLLLKYVFNPYDNTALYYFFLGVLFTTLSAVFLVFFKFKVSLHQMAIAGLSFFIIMLSIHYEINLLVWIALAFIANGWVASSRLHTNSHTVPELITGFVIGAYPQILLVTNWL